VLTFYGGLLRVLLGLVVADGAFGMLAAAGAPAARANGDPDSDVLVYQNLFVVADANMPIARPWEVSTAVWQGMKITAMAMTPVPFLT